MGTGNVDTEFSYKLHGVSGCVYKKDFDLWVKKILSKK